MFSSGTPSSIGKPFRYFTQLVWDTTTHVGVGIATKSVGSNWKTIAVAKYSPQGNIKGQYISHVHPLKKPGNKVFENKNKNKVYIVPFGFGFTVRRKNEPSGCVWRAHM